MTAFGAKLTVLPITTSIFEPEGAKSKISYCALTGHPLWGTGGFWIRLTSSFYSALILSLSIVSLCNLWGHRASL